MYIPRPTCTYIWYVSGPTDILAGKEPKYDEVGRRIDRLKTRKDDSSSDEDSLFLFVGGQWGRLDEKWWTHRKQIGLNRGLARVAFFSGGELDTLVCGENPYQLQVHVEVIEHM